VIDADVRDRTAAEEVAFLGCPEISALEVWPERLRSNGIGTRIIATAESRAAARGYPRVGLGVDDHNPGAGRLYARLGYTESGVHYLDGYQWVDTGGVVHQEAECRPLSRRWSRAPADGAGPATIGPCPGRGGLPSP